MAIVDSRNFERRTRPEVRYRVSRWRNKDQEQARPVRGELARRGEFWDTESRAAEEAAREHQQ